MQHVDPAALYNDGGALANFVRTAVPLNGMRGAVRANGFGAAGPAGLGDAVVDSWDGWTTHQGARADPGGVFVVTEARGTPGVERRDLAVVPGRLHGVSVAGQFQTGNGMAFLSVYDPDNDLILTQTHYIGSSDAPVRRLVTFRALMRTRRVHVRVFIARPWVGDTCRLTRVDVGEVEAPGHGCAEPVIASLASVRGREAMLADAVASLLPQVDRLHVYLNNYGDVPGFLDDPRIDVVRSAAYGDLGDAGKFFWAGVGEAGYRLICDDDLIFPPNYAARMIGKAKAQQNQAVIGIHGILLKQPIAEYYGKAARHVQNYHHDCVRDHAVHVLGTGAVAYHTSTLRLGRQDFQHPNMADIWLAGQAQAQDVPLICATRPYNWIIQNKLASALPTIYAESHHKTASDFDTGAVQNHTVRSHWPVTIKQAPAVMPSRRKLVMAFLTWNRVDYLKRAVATWLETRSDDYDWVVIIADDGSTDATAHYLDQLVLPHELHIIGNRGRYACGQTNTVFELAQKIGFDVGFKADDDIYFTKPGWDRLYLEAMDNSGFDHLCHLNEQHYTRLKRRGAPDFVLPGATSDASGTCSAHIDVMDCDGCLFTFTPRMIDAVGYCDEENFPIRGQWHIDYSVRACRAGFNRAETFFDAKGSNDFIGLQANSDDYRCSLPWGDAYKSTKAPEVLARRDAVIRDGSRVHVAPPPPRWPATDRSTATVNGVFDKVFVINLDRRPDRLQRVVEQARSLGITFERFAAVDGMAAPVRSDWKAYADAPLASLPDGVRAVENSREFYLDYDSDVARVVFQEAEVGGKAIASAGAWGYLKTMIAIFERAMADGLETFLVLDDDAIFHGQFTRLFAKIMAQVPTDWRILQLGTLQYHWEREWIDWHGDNLYRCNGSSIGSHAVGYHRDCLPLLLHRCRRFDLAYDIGPLHAAKRAFADACFTFSPNLVIQDTSESDINTSDVQTDEGRKASNMYRWRLPDYLLQPASKV